MLSDSELTNIERIVESCMGLNPKNRRIGKTWTAIEFAKRIGAMYLTFNMQAAKMVAAEFGYKHCSSIRSWKPEGWNKPIVIDQDGATYVMAEMIQELRTLRQRIKAADRLRYFSGELYGDLCADDEQLTQYNSWFEFEKAIEAYDKAGDQSQGERDEQDS